MMNKDYKYPDTAASNYVITELEKRGVTVQAIADIAYDAEKDYIDGLTKEEITIAVTDILHKREVANNVMTGLALDNLATKGLLDEPLQTIISQDASVYGVDENIGMAIANKRFRGEIVNAEARV